MTDSRVIVEVLSPSTERYDREQKRLYYQQLPSLQEYVLVPKIGARRRDGEAWVHTVHQGGARGRVELAFVEIEGDGWEAHGLSTSADPRSSERRSDSALGAWLEAGEARCVIHQSSTFAFAFAAQHRRHACLALVDGARQAQCGPAIGGSRSSGCGGMKQSC